MSPVTDDFWDRISQRSAEAQQRLQEHELQRADASINRKRAISDVQGHLVARLNQAGAASLAGKLAARNVSDQGNDPWDHSFELRLTGIRPPRVITITTNEQTGKVSWVWAVSVPQGDGMLRQSMQDNSIGRGTALAVETSPGLIDVLIESLFDQDAFEDRRCPEIVIPPAQAAG